MLLANAGFVRFKPDGDPATCVFQVGVSRPNVPAAPGYMGLNFTAFQCAQNADGSLAYDTVVYISNRSSIDRVVTIRITNGENGVAVVDTSVTIGPWHMLAYSLLGALKT